MFVYPYDERRLLLVLQTDHSRLVGQLAAWWDNVQPYLPMVLAAYEHDASWRAWEMRPYIDPEGRPIDCRAGARYMAPYLLDLYREHPEEVVLAQKEGLEVAMKRLTDIEHYEEILGCSPLSEVWYSGVLGGVSVKP